MTPRQHTPTAPAKATPNRSLSNPLKAAALLSALYFLAKLTGLFQQQIITASLPRYATDAYSAAFSPTDFVNYFIAGGALSITFIPIFVELRERGEEEQAWAFFSTLATLMLLVTGAVIALCVVFAEPLTQFLTPGLDGPNRAVNVLPLAVAMTKIILPAQIFFYLGGLVVGVLNAQKRFGATGFTGAIYNVVAVVVAVALWKLTNNPISFAWGILIGAITGNFLLPVAAAWRGPEEFRPRFRANFHFRHPLIKRFFLIALPIMLGVSFPVMDQIIVKRFASSLSDGVLTYLWNSNRLMLVAQSVLAQAASVAAFPYLASDSAARDWKGMAAFIRQGLRRLMFITLPISVLMVLTARPTVDLLFGYGQFNAFEPLHQTATAYAFYSIGLFAWAGQQLVARGFYALKDTKTPTIIGSAITILFFIPLVAFCSRLPNPTLALPLATSLGACVHFAAMTLALETKLAGASYNVALGTERVCGALLRGLCACAVMALVGLFVMKWSDALPLHGKFGDLLRIAVISAAALPAFAFAAQRFDIPEWKWLWKRVGRRQKTEVRSQN